MATVPASDGSSHSPDAEAASGTDGIDRWRYGEGVGSSGQKPRKPNQRHLPKVGSKANVDYEVSQKRKEVFRGTPWIIVGVLLVVVLLAFIAFT